MLVRSPSRAPTLIIGYGNPSRGDDALGPSALDEIERRMARHSDWGQIELVTDFQLQIEFVTDLFERRQVIFIDADVDVDGDVDRDKPFSFGPLVAKADASFTSHALSPASLLMVYRNYYGCDAPPCFLLGIRAYEFELGTPISAAARDNLDAAMTMLEQWLNLNCSRQISHA
jgi:hydrogenase maturation protease